MHNQPREKLRELIVEYGRSLCDDSRRCEALLKDYCGQYKREIFVLISALKNRVAEDLLKASAGVPEALLLGRLIKRLEDELAMTAEAAQWAVESWALALGVISQPLPVTNKIDQKSPSDPIQSQATYIQSSNVPSVQFSETLQKISGIATLINDIAEQINILALNAAIQASAAGDAGPGFTVVADEVQRLAERSSNTTKHLEMLMKTIQAGDLLQGICDFIVENKDIANQIDTVAINAAIQASAAGYAGRGFAVIADEIHRLAKQFQNAINRIETLIKGISMK